MWKTSLKFVSFFAPDTNQESILRISVLVQKACAYQRERTLKTKTTGQRQCRQVQVKTNKSNNSIGPSQSCHSKEREGKEMWKKGESKRQSAS
jgi:hypothetical protein